MTFSGFSGLPESSNPELSRATVDRNIVLPSRLLYVIRYIDFLIGFRVTESTEKSRLSSWITIHNSKLIFTGFWLAKDNKKVNADSNIGFNFNFQMILWVKFNKFVMLEKWLILYVDIETTFITTVLQVVAQNKFSWNRWTVF